MVMVEVTRAPGIMMTTLLPSSYPPLPAPAAPPIRRLQ